MRIGKREITRWKLTSSCHGFEQAPVANLSAKSTSACSISTPLTEENWSISKTSLAYTALDYSKIYQTLPSCMMSLTLGTNGGSKIPASK